ncbi:ABC transporter permease [Haloimpatiens sp. FM7330]|uniref:ABC transporter permease n=1 Tax=Haloimpatiens sp. FM7330 TaxID=3298610 RepID=UPI003633AE89
MKKYTQITYKYLKSQKKRSILTIIGIILSVALISSIGTLLYSMRESEIQKTIKTEGNYHFVYKKGDKKLYNELKNNSKVESVSILTKSKEKIPIEKKYTIMIDKLNETGFKNLPINLKKGRVPKNENEILVEKWLLEKMDIKPKLNDKIKFNIKGKEKEFKLVGILVNSYESQYTGKSKSYTLINSISESSELNLFVKLKSGVSIKNNISEFKNMDKNDAFSINRHLLNLLGESPDSNVNKTLIVVGGVLILLVLISTIAVIYNAFHISVLERIKQFGVLRSIGAAPKQIKTIVLKEALIMSFIAIPLGLLSGIFALKFVLTIVTSDMLIKANEVVVSPMIILVSSGVGLLAVLVSAMLPARTASKVSPLDAIQNRGSFKKEKIKRRRSLLERFMKVESLMAHKNIKRNRKRFRITAFSITISVILFIVFSNFASMALKVNETGNEEENLSYKIQKRVTEKEKPKFTIDDYNKVKNIAGVDTVFKNYTRINTSTLIPKEKLTNKYKEYSPMGNKTIKNSGKEYSVLGTCIEGYDNERLEETKKYLKKGNVDIENMNMENGVLVVVTNREFVKKQKKMVIYDSADFKIGDEIPIDLNNYSIENNKFPSNVFKVKVNGVLEKVPYGYDEYSYGGIRIIASNKLLQKIAQSIDKKEYKKRFGEEFKGINIKGFDVKLKKDADRDSVSSKIKKLEEADSTNIITNVEENLKEEKKSYISI